MKKLMIVDDSNIIRSRIARVIGSPRLPDIQIVGLARDGAEAVEICRRSKPDLVTLDLTLLLEVDPGAVESILTHNLADFNTLDEFRNQFRFIDLAAFMAKHGLTTVEELKEAYHYLITEIRLRTPPAFDPNDPANLIHFPLEVAILLRETLDVTEALRAIKWVQTVADQRRTRAGRSPFAPDKQHLHHRMLEIGHSHRRAVFILWLWAALVSFGTVAVSLYTGRFMWTMIAAAVAFTIAATFVLPIVHRPHLHHPAPVGEEPAADRPEAGIGA